jgi:hypothetical protein
MRWLVAAGCLAVLLARSAHADEAEPEAQVPYTPAVRRSGVSIGLSGGLSLNGASGYPNDVAKIGLREFEASTGVGVSQGGALWVAGALADWFSIGIGTVGGSFKGNGLKGSGGTFGVRVEAFPLFYRGGPWQDLGLSFMAGVGGYGITRGHEKVAEGAATSGVGAGVFYEPIRFWQLSMGPQIEYDHQFSRSLSSHLLLIGWRTVFYGGP